MRKMLPTPVEMLKKYVNASLKRNDISVHKLRSSFAMEFYKHEKNILVLQERMGHKSLTATNVYYGKQNIMTSCPADT